MAGLESWGVCRHAHNEEEDERKGLELKQVTQNHPGTHDEEEDEVAALDSWCRCRTRPRPLEDEGGILRPRPR